MPSDPVAVAEARIAVKIGVDLLSCHRSSSATAAPSATGYKTSVEYAFAMAFRGNNYSASNIDALLSEIKQQWKGFDPLSEDFQDYTSRLKEMMDGSNSPDAISIKPLLVSIDRPDTKYYTVTSVRIYSSQSGNTHSHWTVINSDAVVLWGSQLIRLTVQKPLSDPAAVAEVRAQLDDWAREIARSP